MFSNDLICDILIYIDIHINEPIANEKMCELFHYDKFYMMKKFKKEIGYTIHDYQNRIRIYQSLADFKTSASILKIALAHGFHSLEYFSEIFTKIIGINPTKYRKFVQNPFTLEKEDREKLRMNLSQLSDLKNDITLYKQKRKPKTAPVQKLSLFCADGIKKGGW